MKLISIQFSSVAQSIQLGSDGIVIATRFPHYSVTALPFRFYGKLHFSIPFYSSRVLGARWGWRNDFKGNTVYRDFKTIMKQTKDQSAFYHHHEPPTLKKVSNKNTPPHQDRPAHHHHSLTKHYYSSTTPF